MGGERRLVQIQKVARVDSELTVARCIKSNQNTGSGEERQTKVPSGRSASAVVCGEECFFRRAKPVRVTGGDGQPDQIQQEIDEHEDRRGVEDPSEIASYVDIVSGEPSVFD